VSGLRGATLTVRFPRELAMLAALAYWGSTSVTAPAASQRPVPTPSGRSCG
jgi:hypothetical protein